MIIGGFSTTPTPNPRNLS